ncbi:MAG: molybdenum cofactor biosynthesis protein MoaE [Candidatus Pacebacteria bacterium]|nr:molybdenum cofactor biosynthesis protein MoaE [Candidatus Paceibacterota bacterium]
MITVTTEKFSVGQEYDQFLAELKVHGGIAIFVGLVRDFAETAQGLESVQFLEIEHYPQMAERQLTEIADEAKNRFELTAVTVIHRYGKLAAGEPIVLVLTAAPHRKAAIQGCDFVMDWLKSAAPFWKVEHRSNGQVFVDSKPDDVNMLNSWQKQKS